MRELTYEQAAEVVSGGTYPDDDPDVIAERERIAEKYRECKRTKYWFEDRQAMLLPGFSEAAAKARAWWLAEFVRSKTR